MNPTKKPEPTPFMKQVERYYFDCRKFGITKCYQLAQNVAIENNWAICSLSAIRRHLNSQPADKFKIRDGITGRIFANATREQLRAAIRDNKIPHPFMKKDFDSPLSRLKPNDRQYNHLVECLVQRDYRIKHLLVLPLNADSKILDVPITRDAIAYVSYWLFSVTDGIQTIVPFLELAAELLPQPLTGPDLCSLARRLLKVLGESRDIPGDSSQLAHFAQSYLGYLSTASPSTAASASSTALGSDLASSADQALNSTHAKMRDTVTAGNMSATTPNDASAPVPNQRPVSHTQTASSHRRQSQSGPQALAPSVPANSSGRPASGSHLPSKHRATKHADDLLPQTLGSP